MSLHLKKWMQHFWKHLEIECESECLEVDSLGTKTSILRLPDDVIINILSKLPTQSVLECKLVVSSWNQLCSTPYFAEIHQINVTPLLLIEDRFFNRINTKKPMFLLLQGSGKNATFKKVHLRYLQLMRDSPYFQLLCSCNGILIFSWERACMYLIYNPITRTDFIYKEKGHKIFGFFFHELEKDYKMLIYEAENDKKGVCYYYLFGLRNKVKRRLGISPHKPLLSAFDKELAIVFSGVVFWIGRCYYDKPSELSKQCSESIVMFDLMTENFNIMPHPGLTCSRCLDRCDGFLHSKMRFLEIDGKLSLCNLCEKAVEIWILEDLNNWIWVKTYVVKLDRDYICADSGYWAHPIVAIHSGNLLLNWPRRGLFGCNLAKNYIWKFKVPYDYDRDEGSFYAVRYTSSFIDFKSGNVSN